MIIIIAHNHISRTSNSIQFNSYTTIYYIYIPSLENRRTYLFLCECFKFVNLGISPNIDVIAIQNDQHDQLHNLRSVTASNLPIPRMNKTVGQRALAYLGPRTFNTLPNHIKTSITLPIFKTQLRKYLLLRHSQSA